jgi:hypothetical protein
MLTVMAACSDDDVEDLAEEILPSTRARVIHLSPDTPEVDVDFELIEIQGTIVGLSYKEASPYNEVSTSTSEVTFRDASGNEIASLDDPDFDHDDYNTVYLVNLSDSLQIIRSQDNRSTSASMAKVRFVHACADCSAVDVKKDLPSEEALFENDAFREITDYALATPGNYAFAITEAGNTVDALATFTPVTLAKNGIYTIVLFGTIDETDDHDFGIRVYEDSGSGTEWAEPPIGQ